MRRPLARGVLESKMIRARRAFGRPNYVNDTLPMPNSTTLAVQLLNVTAAGEDSSAHSVEP